MIFKIAVVSILILLSSQFQIKELTSEHGDSSHFNLGFADQTGSTVSLNEL